MTGNVPWPPIYWVDIFSSLHYAGYIGAYKVFLCAQTIYEMMFYMTHDQLYQLYSEANHGSPPVSKASLLSFPSLNFDIYDDGSTLVNRLFYVLPLPGTSSLFIFFQDNSFTKDSQGDLSLVDSSLNTWNPQ